MPVKDLKLSADVGGTFTDLVLQEGPTRWTAKVLTTPQAPETGVWNGVTTILEKAGRSLSEVTHFVHGTTLATNAVIERKGAAVALLTTEGFRDALETGTESRYDQFELALLRPRPLVDRRERFEIPERLSAKGEMLLELDEDAVMAVAAQLEARGITSVAVSYLHAFVNPVHEQRTAEILRKRLPDLAISLSHEVSPEIREYERTSTTVTNAYVQPLMKRYLTKLEAMLAEAGFTGFFGLMASSGGLTSVELATRFPVRLVESGPAGGAVFAAQVAASLAEPQVLAFDMGGTTAKISVINDFRPDTNRMFEVDRAARFLKGSGLPIRIPVIEMVEIGAGGGSIAHIDGLGRVAVGPESASSDPGPVCYGRGGTHPAVTDADLALGLLDADAFAGGMMTLDRDGACEALVRDIGDTLSLGAEQSGHAAYEMVCENMASAARVHAIERGAVPNRYTLIAFGGAAPLHVARVAEKIGAQKVVVPANAGVGSAVGFLDAPISYEIVRTGHQVLGSIDLEAVGTLLADMESEAHKWVSRASGDLPLSTHVTAFMRYVGQGHEIAVEMPGTDLSQAVAEMRTRFEETYREQYKRDIPGAEIEIMSWSVEVTTPRIEASAQSAVARSPEAPAPVSVRQVFDGFGNRFVETPVYERDALAQGAAITGPAIITEAETSTYISAAFDAHIGAMGAIIMERKQQEGAAR